MGKVRREFLMSFLAYIMHSSSLWDPRDLQGLPRARRKVELRLNTLTRPRKHKKRNTRSNAIVKPLTM